MSEQESKLTSVNELFDTKPTEQKVVTDKKPVEEPKEEKEEVKDQPEQDEPVENEDADDQGDEDSKDDSTSRQEQLQKAIDAEQIKLKELRKKRKKAERELERIKDRSNMRGDESPWETDEDDSDDETTQRNSRALTVEQKLALQSVDTWRELKPEAQEHFDAFDEAVEENPNLWNAFMNSENPGKFAYQYGEKILFEKKYGSSPSEIKEKLKAELAEETKTSGTKGVELKKKKSLEERIPTNLSGSTRAKSGSEKAEVRLKTTGEFWGR